MTKKVLIIHGFGCNSQNSLADTKTIQSQLINRGFEFECLDGTILLDDDDLLPGLFYNSTRAPLRAWWHLKNDKLGQGIKDAESYIKQKYGNDEEIVGIMGHSQGGSLVSIIAANNWIPSLKFAIAFGGFIYPIFGGEDKEIYEKDIKVPFLTVAGVNDTTVLPKYSVTVTDELVKDGHSTILKFDHAHIFTDDAKDVEKIFKWISPVASD